MAQINLLKRTTADASGSWNTIANILVKVLVLAVLGMAGYFAYTYISVGRVAKNQDTLEQSISKLKIEISSNKDRNEIVMRQAQLSELDAIITSHVYWTEVIPEFAKATLRSATINAFKAVSDGTISISLTVPDVAEMDKFFQIFDLATYNKYFSDVRVSGIATVEQDGIISKQAEVKLQFDTSLLTYKEPAQATGTPINITPR